MKKSNKLRNLFYIGLVPLSFLFIIFVFFTIGIFRESDSYSKSSIRSGNVNPTEHKCIKPEKIVIHDTIYIECKRKHFENSKKTEPVKIEEKVTLNPDSNNSEKKLVE